VNEYRWFNPSQPQTLQIAVLLCYISAVMGLLFGGGVASLPLLVALAAGGFGIANEKRWGYTVAVVASLLQVLVYFLVFGIDTLQNLNLLISFMFDAALVLLLLHPMSRDYQRIWFR
jgi:hypothetical protein